MRNVVILVLLAGCDDTIFGPGGGGNTTPSVDGYAGVQQMVQDSCTSCHGTTTNAVGLNLDLDGGVASGVQDLARQDCGDLAHGPVLSR